MRRFILVAGLAAVLSACGEPARDPERAPQNTGLRLLGSEAADGFARAVAPRELVFPADHGSHPDYRTEWWYFTGNVATAGGRHFGFELTFFRYALAPPSVRAEDASAWRTEQVWMAHFAVTDTAGARFIARERLTREALSLSGAAAAPLRVWEQDSTTRGV